MRTGRLYMSLVIPSALVQVPRAASRQPHRRASPAARQHLRLPGLSDDNRICARLHERGSAVDGCCTGHGPLYNSGRPALVKPAALIMCLSHGYETSQSGKLSDRPTLCQPVPPLLVCNAGGQARAACRWPTIVAVVPHICTCRPAVTETLADWRSPGLDVFEGQAGVVHHASGCELCKRLHYSNMIMLVAAVARTRRLLPHQLQNRTPSKVVGGGSSRRGKRVLAAAPWRCKFVPLTFNTAQSIAHLAQILRSVDRSRVYGSRSTSERYVAQFASAIHTGVALCMKSAAWDRRAPGRASSLLSHPTTQLVARDRAPTVSCLCHQRLLVTGRARPNRLCSAIRLSVLCCNWHWEEEDGVLWACCI